MKIFGIILIVAGVLMLVYKGFNVQTEKKVVDIGPVEINKKENRWIGWPTYLGAIAIAGGVVLLIADKKKTA
jgi:drug/metabolite transporter (DMT)-like permease